MIDKKMAFVLMPSGKHGEYKDAEKEANFIYKGIITEAIRKACDSDIQIVRETDNRKPGAITRSIIEHIAESDICIVDITGQNPNVFLELGVRYSLRKKCTILLKQEDTSNPFDIHNYRCVVYDPKYEGAERAIKDISEAIMSVQTLSKQYQYTDSLVWEVYPEMTIRIPDIIGEPDEQGMLPTQHMSWKEYWEQLEKVVEKIRNYFKDGRFVPSVIIGISNGGLAYADLLGRELFQSIPILSLWADRQNKEAKFFENPINNSVVEGIEQYTPEGEKVNILLVDDIVASGNTVIQALNYLKHNIPSGKIYFLPLFSRNEKYFDMIKENVIWLSDIFNWEENDIMRMHSTDKIFLPYKKEIRST